MPTLAEFTDWIILIHFTPNSTLDEQLNKELMLVLDKLGLLYQVHSITSTLFGICVHCPDDVLALQVRMYFSYQVHYGSSAPLSK